MSNNKKTVFNIYVDIEDFGIWFAVTAQLFVMQPEEVETQNGLHKVSTRMGSQRESKRIAEVQIH